MTASSPLDLLNTLVARLEAFRPETVDSDQVCTIFVGKDYEPFRIPRINLGRCDFLLAREKHHAKLGYFVNLSQDPRAQRTALTAEEFCHIAGYLRTCQIELASPKEADQMLDRTNDDDAKDLATFMCTAAKVKYIKLQEKVLEMFQSTPPSSADTNMAILRILCDAPCTEGEAERAFQKLILDRFISDFWVLAESDLAGLRATLDTNDALKRAVFEGLKCASTE